MPTENDALSQAADTTPRTDPMPLASALAALDPADDSHWTSAGLPSVAAVSDIVGAPVSRADIETVAPDLKRDGAADPAIDPAPAAPVEPQPPADIVATQPTLQDVIDDIAFLRQQFGWPTKE